MTIPYKYYYANKGIYRINYTSTCSYIVEVGTGYGWYRSTEDIVDLKTKGKIVSEQEAEVYLMMKVLNT